MKLLKKIITSRVGMVVVAFLAGGAAAAFLLPEKITIKRDTKIEYVDRVVEKEVVKYVDRVVEREVVKEVQVKKVWTKTTYPDGKIVETEIYEENSQQVDRMLAIEKEKFTLQLAETEKKYQEEIHYLKEHKNPKHFNVYAGAGIRLTDFKDPYYLAGMQADVWGPLMIGGQVQFGSFGGKDVGGAITVGFKF